MSFLFSDLIEDILLLFDTIYNKFSMASHYAFMTLPELLTYVDDNVGSFNIPDWVISIFSSGVFGEYSLISLMFGSALSLMLLYGFAKWALDILG